MGGKYPSYYLQNFHYQSDGWLSARSAEIYDYQVESLFLGTADAMRRQVLPHLTEYIQSLKNAGTPEADIKVLDVATGTGRFASFIMQNFADLRLDALDLSPFYLAEAKKLLNKYPGVTYVEAPAEAVPAAEEQYDMITCVYLFHELPAKSSSSTPRSRARFHTTACSTASPSLRTNPTTRTTRSRTSSSSSPTLASRSTHLRCTG